MSVGPRPTTSRWRTWSTTAAPRWRTSWEPWLTWCWPSAATSCKMTSWWYEHPGDRSPIGFFILRIDSVAIEMACANRSLETCCVETRTLTLLKSSGSSSQRYMIYLTFYPYLINLLKKFFYIFVSESAAWAADNLLWARRSWGKQLQGHRGGLPRYPQVRVLPSEGAKPTNPSVSNRAEFFFRVTHFFEKPLDGMTESRLASVVFYCIQEETLSCLSDFLEWKPRPVDKSFGRFWVLQNLFYFYFFIWSYSFWGGKLAQKKALEGHGF